jgi:hypothetical protein
VIVSGMPLKMPYLCTVSARSLQNWDLCKESGLWGIPGHTRTRLSHVVVGDRIFVWLGRTGFVAAGRITGKPRPPEGEHETPWRGGLLRWTVVVPFEVDIELPHPLRLPFDRNQQQAKTGLYKGNFQRSFAPISAGVAMTLDQLIRGAAEGGSEL